MKYMLGKSVLVASQERIQWIFDTFKQICLSFSGGKDSTVLFHLVAQEARKRKRKFDVIFLDWEVQYQATIDHVYNMKIRYEDCISNFYWVAIPITTESGVSQYQTKWTAWEPNKQWVRNPPACAITDPYRFPFYDENMTFEAFMPAFNHWVAAKTSAVTLLGIRADESLNRFMSLTNQRKLRYADDKPWTTSSLEGFYYLAYPIYDWRVTDIWTFLSKQQLPYNPIYDLMYQAGVPLSHMRICEPFGPEQRKGLWLYHILEPDTWDKACQRVSGAHSSAIYLNPKQKKGYFGTHIISKPDTHTWQSYALFLLDSLPEHTAEHYRNKIAVYLRWYQQRDYPSGIPDEQDNDCGYKDIPSWRRICKTILRHDYWCRSLSFSPTKSHHYERYKKNMKLKREEWKLML